jgi:hypothetical protein
LRSFVGARRGAFFCSRRMTFHASDLYIICALKKPFISNASADLGADFLNYLAGDQRVFPSPIVKPGCL